MNGLARIRRRYDRIGADAGYVALIVAISVPLIFALAALAVDVANWHAQAARLQNAADAAALAGVVYLPADPTTATSIANDFAKRNGYTSGTGVTVTAKQVTGHPSQMQVTISATVSNGFGAAIGRPSTVITRSSVADYQAPIPVGGPCNVLGNEPSGGAWGPSKKSSSCSTTPQLWLSISGPGEPKQNGDRYQANVCNPPADRCSGTNQDYDPAGYFYVVRVKQAGTVDIEVYDPSNVVCAAGPACPGDGRPSAGRPVETTSYIVRGPYHQSRPDDTPVVPGCTPMQYKPDDTALSEQWVPLCTITDAQPGDYLVQVRTNIPLGSNPADDALANPSLSNAGANYFSLRASYSDSRDNNNISLFGLERMGLYANQRNFNSNFFLARVPSGAAGKHLRVEFFDIGDGSGGWSLSILPPSEATAGGSPVTAFANCQGTGPVSGAMPTCSIRANTGTAFQGKIESISVPIPVGYTCNDASPDGCWTRIGYAFAAPSDATTWTASLEGDPVRIIR